MALNWDFPSFFQVAAGNTEYEKAGFSFGPGNTEYEKAGFSFGPVRVITKEQNGLT